MFISKTEIVAQQEGEAAFNYLQLFQLLGDQELPNLPPGGGLFAK